MKIKLSRDALLGCLQRCQSVVERRHTIPILANVLMHAEADRLSVTATDLEVGIRSHCPATVGAPGSVTVSARKLFDIVKLFDPEAEVSMAAEGSELRVESGRARYKLAIMDPSEYPGLNEEEDGASILVDASALASMISATQFAMSTDETRKYLTGTLFELDRERHLRLVTTDGHRLALDEVALDQDLEPRQCIVPKKAVGEIRKLCEETDGQVQLWLGERQIRLSAGPNLLVSKLIDQKFPVYQDVIPTGNPAHAVLERAAFDQALKRTMVVANEFTHDVRLDFTEAGLDISAHNTEQEEAHEHLDVDYQGPELSIGFNGRYLRDALGAMLAPSVRMEIKDELSPVLLYEEQGSAARYVIMPMRI